VKPPEQLVINETAIRYTQDALSLTGETQAFEISSELVAKLADIRQVAIEKVTGADGSGNNTWEPGVYGWVKV